MRFLVCGGRDFIDYNLFERVIKLYVCMRDDVVIHGGARGADSFAHFWSNVNNVSQEVYRADWNKYGKSAGYIRNKQMLDEGKPDYVIAFPGGKGTAMMIRLAKKAGVEVIEIDRENS